MQIGKNINGRVVYSCGKCPWISKDKTKICEVLFNSEAQEAGKSAESVGAVIHDLDQILPDCPFPNEKGCNFDEPLN